MTSKKLGVANKSFYLRMSSFIPVSFFSPIYRKILGIDAAEEPHHSPLLLWANDSDWLVSILLRARPLYSTLISGIIQKAPKKCQRVI